MTTRPRASLPSVVNGFWIGIVLSTLAGILICAYYGLVRHMGYPRSWPLFLPAARFSDFTIFQGRFQHFHSMAFYAAPGLPFTYPAPVAMIYEFYYNFTPRPLAFFLATIMLAGIIPAALFGRALIRRGLRPNVAYSFAATLVLTSYPLALMIDRANMEIMVWIVLAIGMWAYATGRLRTAAVFFGVAASLKLFPFVYLALFVPRRQYKMLALGIASFIGTTILSLWILGPTIRVAAKGVADGLLFFKTVYMSQLHVDENGFDHSLFSLIKTCVLYVRPSFDLRPLLSDYLAFTALAGLLLYFLRIWRLPQVNQVFALAISSILFTAFSGDGTLIHLYIPLAMLVFFAIDQQRLGRKTRGLPAAFACLVFLLTPENYILRHGIRYGSQFKSLILLVLFTIVLIYPFIDVHEKTGSEPAND